MPLPPRRRMGRSVLAILTLIRRMAVTISTRLFGRGTSRLPMYWRERKSGLDEFPQHWKPHGPTMAWMASPDGTHRHFWGTGSVLPAALAALHASHHEAVPSPQCFKDSAPLILTIK